MEPPLGPVWGHLVSWACSTWITSSLAVRTQGKSVPEATQPGKQCVNGGPCPSRAAGTREGARFSKEKYQTPI